MSDAQIPTKEKYPDVYHDMYSKTVFGFWVYLITDFILFATLFATYAVLVRRTFGGPGADDLFDLKYNLIETCLLLGASFTSGLGGAFAHRRQKRKTLWAFAATLLLGLGFLGMMIGEFSYLSSLGHNWSKSAFLSAYYTLIGTHGVHVIFAICWIFVLIPPVCFHGITNTSLRRLTCLRMFWQFLSIIWTFIFTIVYLMGGA